MLLNTWLSAARRHFSSFNPRRIDRAGTSRSLRTEPLEERMLLSSIPVALSALVINADNQAAYTDTLTGALSVSSAQLAGKDSLVIEGISVSTSSLYGINVNLSNISLKRLAIESVNVSQYTSVGLNIQLTNVTGLESVAIEDVFTTGTAGGLKLNFNNTDTKALTIDDSTFPGIVVEARNGADIHNGVVTGNTVFVSKQDVAGVVLNVVSTQPTLTTAGVISTADDFQIIDNVQIATAKGDAVQVNASGFVNSTTKLTASNLDGLTIRNNTVGTSEGANVSFRAEGDTFLQPFVLQNNATRAELLQTFVLDLTDIGLEFDEDPTNGKPFTAVAGSGVLTGVSSAVVSPDKKKLTVTFTDFNPGESLQFLIDVDLAGGIPSSIFGNQLIGADVSFAFSGNKSVIGQMAGDPNFVSASQFIVGAGATGTGTTHGIHIAAAAMPVTNFLIEDNIVTGAPGHSLYLDAQTYSDMTGQIQGNQFSASGGDGIRFAMKDSNFHGAVDGNTIANNGGNGISILPTSTRSGPVQGATAGSPGNRIKITSLGHNLKTGDRVMLQGLVNDDKTLAFPGNGLFTITRLPGLQGNDQFWLDGTDVTVPGATWKGGGAWYVPDFRSGGTGANDARGFVQIDLKAEAVPKAVTAASNTPDIAITSAAHGLKTGDRIRITGVQGNTAANGTFTVTVTSANVFLLKGVTGNGVYTVSGTWVPLTDSAPNGDVVSKGILGNSITGNLGKGIFSNSVVGTTVRADVAMNTVSENEKIGIQFQSHSFGLGTSLPLDPNDGTALPANQDLGFNINIGHESNDQGNTGGGNTLHQNVQAGIALEALDYGTGSFEIWNNTITSTQDDKTASTPYSGEGVFVRLDRDLVNTETISVLQKSIIKQNVIGVDNLGNEGNGLFFSMSERSKIQDLDVVENNFLNNGLDGFHFERKLDASLNSVRVEKNHATNNGRDGFDLSATNTVKDRLDFLINENDISDNAQYGVRLSVLADARVNVQFDRNLVTRNGHTPAGQGFHPNDGVAGSTGAAGGVGIFAFEQPSVILHAQDTKIDANIGDGLSIDAFIYDDALELDATFINTTFNSNTLAGLRNHGTAFGQFSITGCHFDLNGEDGFRSVSIDDKTDFNERRVGGMNIYVSSLKSTYSQNTKSGMKLGQGVSAVLGDGSVANANTFNLNGEDGLKITQTAGPFLLGQNTFDWLRLTPTFQYVKRRLIQADTNFFSNNKGDGVDIGHFAQTEGGNVEQGDEVAGDTNVVLTNAEITSNLGDGVEYLADSWLRISPVVGGGQDVEYPHISSLAITDSQIANNGKRGVDVLNRVGEDSRVSIVNSQIINNDYEGIYVLNTASHFQLQESSADPLLAYLETSSGRSDDFSRAFSTSPAKVREVNFQISPNIELRIEGNLIESNGTRNIQSVVPVNQSATANDQTGNVNTDWTHDFVTQTGTLGGLVVRVGTVDSVGRIDQANPDEELGLSGIDAEIVSNTFDGNIGADVYFDSFTSQIPAQSQGNHNSTDVPNFSWNQGYRDPLSRFDLVFRDNSGNSLDVINGFAYLDNWESEFKSRSGSSSAPNHAHNPLGPGGPLSPDRFRNQTRTTGYFNSVGDVPSSQLFPYVMISGFLWAYDGWGTPTWRVESDFSTSNFPTVDPTLGFSDFYDVQNLGIKTGEEAYQWDTGKNAPGFVGLTPYSLQRGDVFNVRANEDPIPADSLEENDSFLGATQMGVVSGPGYSVNALATGNLLTLEKKGDRDYYQFTAATSGALSVHLGATDPLGDTLQLMVYEVDRSLKNAEVPLQKNGNGTPQFVAVGPGANGILASNVVAGHDYIVEIQSTEAANVGVTAKTFAYGTARSYTLTIDAPVGVGGGAIAGAGGAGAGAGGVTGGSGGTTDGGGGAIGGGSVVGGSKPGNPTLISIGPVTPNPRSTAVNDVSIQFSEDVTGFDIMDLRLTRGGVNIPLTDLIVVPIDATLYTVNLSKLTGDAGSYVLTLVATGSGIRDTDNSQLTTGGSNSWTVSNTVTSTLDTPDTNPGDGVGRDIGGRATLRAAVMESNASPGDDVINLAAATYTFSAAGRFEDQALMGDLDIRGNLIIRGVSPKTTIIDAALLDRVFHVFPGASLTLENLTIKNGSSFDGGGIFNEGILNLTNVNVICNVAANQGGGIYNTGTMTVKNAAIAQNVAGSRGGGVDNLGTSSYLNTTISSNVAVARGGGIFNENSATASIINATVATNYAGSRAGGLGSESNVGTRIGNSIVERNSTDAKVPVTHASTGKDLMGSVVSQGFNVIQVLDTRQPSGTAAGLLTSDKFGRDAAPYANLTNVLQYGLGNGVGFQALKPNAGAVDAGSNSLYPVDPRGQLDAIGNPRLIEGNGDGVFAIDLGAVEYLLSNPVALFIATPNPAGLNELITFDGRTSTHPNPAAGAIVSWEWDFDWNPGNVAPTKPLTDPNYNPYENFTLDAVGMTATRSYTNASRNSYIVRLIVTDTSGNKGFIDHVVRIGIPTKPVLQRPFAVTSDLTPTFSWQASPALYRLVVDNVTTGKTKVINVGNLTTTKYTPTTILVPGRYKATVTATNGSGSSVSNAYFFDVTRLALTSPVNLTYDITPVFKWVDVPGSSRYDLWVSRLQPTYQDQVLRNQFISGTSYEAQASLGSGTFTWWVRAYDADGGVGDWSVPKTFTIGRPEFSSPAAVTMNTKPKFTWTNMGSPRYELWVNEVGGKAKIIYQPSLTTNSYTPTTALPNGKFDVWVRAVAADGEAGLWSLAYRFQMDYRVGPKTIAPIGVTTDTTPTFRWQPIDGAANYDLWVNNTTTGVTQVIRATVPQKAGATEITYTPATAMPASNYRWWVQAITANGTRGAWSAGTDFLVPVPTFILPAGTVTTNTPEFRWNGVKEFVKYELWVNNQTTGVAQVIHVTNLTAKTYTPTLPLENGSFIAWVRGFDAVGNASQWSTPANFTINATIGNAPIAVTPSGIANNNKPTFTWQGVNGAKTYEILVKNISDAGQPTVLNVNSINGLSYTSTKTLAPNKNYRWWVRAVSVNNIPGPWSQPQDFRVVSSDLPEAPGSNSPLDVEKIASVVLTGIGEGSIDDEVRSITAHPAGNVVQLTPEAINRYLAEFIRETEFVEPVAEIDAVMEELALDAFFIERDDVDAVLTVSDVAPVSVVKSDETSAEEQTTLEVISAGLLASTIVRQSVPEKKKKRGLRG